jgi:hypothetical protein
VRPEEKSIVLRNRISALATAQLSEIDRIFERNSDLFGTIPGSPFAYWVTDRLRDSFRKLSKFESESRTAKCGMGTLDDFRFLRARHEVSARNGGASGWVDYVGPRSRSLAYTDIFLQVNWKHEGRELKSFVEARVGSASRKIQSESYYFRPGLAWPLRGSRFSAQEVPSGCTFSVAGKMAFVPTDERMFFLGLFNSSVLDSFIGLFAGKVAGVQYEAGLIQDLPIPDGSLIDKRKMAQLAREAWLSQQRLDSLEETSTTFVLPAPLNKRVMNVDSDAAKRALRRLQGDIDSLAYELYGMSADDRSAIEASSHNLASVSQNRESDANCDELDDVDNENLDEPSPQDQSVTLLSWLVGVAYGRFDPRLVIGERQLPHLREPFEPLPSRSPAMYPEGEEPAERPDILVDDEGHPKDLTAHVQHWAEQVGLELPADVRPWLARAFSPVHIKMYSKSRRKAPIYWQLATSSASYSIWLYIHVFTKDTLFRVQNDYVTPKLVHEERQIETLRAEAGSDSVAAQRKAIETQQAFVEELRAFLDEVKRVAPLWNPNLDDGVIINFAPLWRLVPHHKPWQKELKSTWDALCAGKYDWAHLGMYLWPERVVPKCAGDRSLAIAHGLEDVFWYQDDDEKWKPREAPTKPIDALVNERTSPAVKAALKSLLEAPEAAGGARRARRGRA